MPEECLLTGSPAGQPQQAAVGVLNLHYETVQRALTEQALALLLPPDLHFSFSPHASPQPAQRDDLAPQHAFQEPQHAQHEPQQGQREREGQNNASLQSMLQPASQDTQAAHGLPTSNSISAQQQWQEPQQPARQQSGHLLRYPSQSTLRHGLSSDGVQFRLLPGSSDGTGMNSGRGSLWAMVVPVGQLVPLTLLVSSRCLQKALHLVCMCPFTLLLHFCTESTALSILLALLCSHAPATHESP